MRAQHLPESVGIEIPGNPEFISDEELERVADAVIEQAVARLTMSHTVHKHGF